MFFHTKTLLYRSFIFTSNSEKMSDINDLVRCKELIIYRFKMDDLKYCLNGVSCNSTGKKDELQRRLRNILEIEKTQRRTKKIILDRGIDMGYIERTEQGGFVDVPTPKVIPKSMNIVLSHEDNITMKKLYFHKNINNVTGWKIVRTKDNNQTILNWVLSKDFLKSLIKSKEVGEQIGNCFFLRCTKIEQNTQKGPLNDCYPLLMRLQINEEDFTKYLPREICYSSADKKNRLPVPTLLNDPLMKLLQSNYNEGRVKIELRFDRDSNKNDTFGFALFTSTSRTVQEICQEITSKKRVTFEKFDGDLRKFMSKSDDVTLECAKISLCSSITYKTIATPFRGKNCNHISPDDLKDYIEINKNSESWLCKICKHICTPDDIMIDEFFTDVLTKHPAVDGIELYPGMKYKLYGGSEILSMNKSTVTEKTKVNEVNFIFIDSDDEFDTPLNGQHFSISQFKNEVNVRKSPIRSNSNTKQIECILIDDSSDEEPPQKRNRSEDISHVINGIPLRDISSRMSEPENHITQSVILNSDHDINIQSSTDIMSLRDSFVSSQVTTLNDSLTHPNEIQLSDHNENPSIRSNNFNTTRQAIEKLNEVIQSNCFILDELIKGIVGGDMYNIDRILDQELEIGTLPINHLSLKPMYMNKELKNTSNVDSIIPLFYENSTIKQYLKEQYDQLSELEKYVNDVNKNCGYGNPSEI
uniref:SP-RING-type domain-containing protein n=1 Tax=Strongyloides venezuelensis TaxID=75913 RepID=A0A0K0F9Q9_STRVS